MRIPKTVGKNSLPEVGRTFNIYENGEMQLQGLIADITGDRVTVLLCHGPLDDQHETVTVAKSEITWNDETQSGWKFFRNREEWLYTLVL